MVAKKGTNTHVKNGLSGVSGACSSVAMALRSASARLAQLLAHGPKPRGREPREVKAWISVPHGGLGIAYAEESFWREVKDRQAKHFQAAKEAQARRARAKGLQARVKEPREENEGENEGSALLPNAPERGDEPPIREIEAPKTMHGLDAPGIPSSSVVLAERLLSAKSPGEVLSLAKRAYEALQTEVNPQQRMRRLAQLALALQLLARQAQGAQKAPILKDHRLPRLIQALQHNVEGLDDWILAAGFCGLARLGTLSLRAAQNAAPASEALLQKCSERLADFDTAQAGLVLASLAHAPELLGSKPGAALRSKLVSMLELQSQELPPEACALLAPAALKLRAQSLGFGLAKRLSASQALEGLGSEALARAAQSLAALRCATPRLMELTEKTMQQQIHLCTPRAVVNFAAALSEGRGDSDAFKDFLMPAARSFLLDFNPRDLCTLAESFVKARRPFAVVPEDYIVTLTTVSQMPPEMRAMLPTALVEELLQALQQRGYGPWRLEMETVVHLLEALRNLRIEDEALLELVCDRLPSSLQSETSLALLVRLLNCLGELPKRSRVQVAAHLQRRKKLHRAFKKCFSQHVQKNLDLEASVTVAKALAQFGFEDPATQEFLDRLTASTDLPRLSAHSASDLCWSLAQFTWQIEWNRRFAWSLLHRLYDMPVPEALQDDLLDFPAFTARPDAGSLLRLAWGLSVLNEAVPAPLLAELHVELRGELPKDWCGFGLRMLQEVALHRRLGGQEGDQVLDMGFGLGPESECKLRWIRELRQLAASPEGVSRECSGD
ncbi:unnamed protein product [Effrenium voratum]|nr:unnamed protein product [Effrenium voratum]